MSSRFDGRGRCVRVRFATKPSREEGGWCTWMRAQQVNGTATTAQGRCVDQALLSLDGSAYLLVRGL
jgi:hypothetical protein